MLKQLEEIESHAIVSCEQLGETLQAAPALLFLRLGLKGFINFSRDVHIRKS